MPGGVAFTAGLTQGKRGDRRLQPYSESGRPGMREACEGGASCGGLVACARPAAAAGWPGNSPADRK
jgi:hypothetical protein